MIETRVLIQGPLRVGRPARLEAHVQTSGQVVEKIIYRDNIFDEMDLEAVIRRKPAVAIVDELAHTNIEGAKNQKRYEDVLELLDNGISVITAVNIQHIESLNDVIRRTTQVQVRETVPDCFFQRIK